MRSPVQDVAGRRIAHTVTAGILLVASLAGCGGDSGESAEPLVTASAKPSIGPGTPEPVVSSPSKSATVPVSPVVNGRITDAESHFRIHVDSYSWLAFDSASDRGLFAARTWCNECRPVAVKRTRLTVVGPASRVATLVCPDGPTCRARRFGNAATLGPGADEVTVESGDRTLNVVGYDGTVHRTLDFTASLPRGRDIVYLAWSPDGSRLAIETYRENRGPDIWLVERDGTPKPAYSPNGPSFGRPVAWSPDGESLLFDRLLPNAQGGIRSVGADVVVLRRLSAGSTPAMTRQVLYRSNRHFDWAGNLAWSPDGTRVAVRVRDSIVEISAEDGEVLARHPHIGGWLIWLSRDR